MSFAVRDRSGETGCTPSPQTVRMAGLLMMLSLTERIKKRARVGASP